MKNDTWNEGLSHVDDELIEEYYILKEKYQKKRRRKELIMRIAAATACISIIATAGASLVIRRTSEAVSPVGGTDKPTFSESTEHNKTYIPNANEIRVFTAEDIAKMYKEESMSAVPTNRYKKVCVSGDEFLEINEIPKKEYLEIYTMGEGLPDDEAKFDAFNDKMATRLKAVIGPTHTYVSQNVYNYFVQIYASFGSAKDAPILTYLYGEQIKIDQRMSDDDMIANIDTIKNNLFKLFDTSFTDVKIKRRFNDNYGSTGLVAESVSIYFYNESDHPMNPYVTEPLSDHILLEFDNSPGYTLDVVSDSILEVVDIFYREHRMDTKDLFSVSSYSPMISLEEAEKLLEKGYVFGGHSCPLCMANQEKVSFDDYDYVSFEYVREYPSSENGNESRAFIPFYAFYKEIGMADNGNKLFAKTYVPAIEIDGYEEYFESQAETHHN